ncbi:MAG: lysyl-tRNA synthetase, class [Actinomycetota bacterium]|jgi:lysyl-tRNA synthetase class 2|nr:lysyl-tRNA synthetase, class [Actinomycetota bacterium]
MTDQVEYPYRFERTATIGPLRDQHGSIEAGTDTGQVVNVAGRIMTMREHGKVAFADLMDASGRIQLFAQLDVLGEDGMSSFIELGVGDIVGVEGEVVMTRRGELSVKVQTITLLAKCQRSMPEKWHGMSDVEVRYRQRYLDLISNEVARNVLVARSKANHAIRSFFDERGFLEVETPLLQPIAGGAVARPFVTHHNALDIDLYLRVAPELYLKRLLIGGAEKVYELNRSFRNEGVSTRHNPEFTMLEAYEAYVDYEDTMALVEALVLAITRAVGTEATLAAPFRRMTMFEAIKDATDRDLETPWREGNGDAVRAQAEELGVRLEKSWSPGKALFEIYEMRVEKELVEPTFIMGMPKDVSPLAKDHRSIPGFTEHADLVIGGVEIAPIYSELNDPAEQRRRFEQQTAARAQGDDEATVADEDFLEALSYGMPPAGGFGLGIDRLLMHLLDLPSIREVIMFPTLKPEA